MRNSIAAHLTRLRLLVCSVLLLFIVCMGLVGTSISAEAGFMTEGAQQTKPAPVTQAAPAEKTVEQTQKNIQVLNGLPASELGPVMNYIGSSLGVKCTYCHVNKDDKWDFASDEKPEKDQARDMIKMVLAINKANFKGNPAVSCYMCHRGKAEPIRVPQLPLAEPTPFADMPTTTTIPKETNPTAEQILTKYTEALGGAAAIEKLKTRSMKGTWLTSTGITLGYEVYQTAPDRIYTVLNTPKQGTIERGFDGHAGWEKSQRGLRELQDREVFLLTRYPDLFKDIKLQGQFTRISFSRKDTIDGNEVYVLSGLGTDGKGERLYFDTKTGLLLRRITSMRTMVGLIPEQVDFADYRDVGGLKLPFTMRIMSIDSFYSSTRMFTEIKLNVPVDETKFNKPPAPATSPSP
ncbi:MAG TPA: c-type cytochrome [Pyrinomonadaceae bacterium]|nr:c-type cytochrome [Pyrinomonadaceae bacterium]